MTSTGQEVHKAISEASLRVMEASLTGLEPQLDAAAGGVDLETLRRIHTATMAGYKAFEGFYGTAAFANRNARGARELLQQAADGTTSDSLCHAETAAVTFADRTEEIKLLGPAIDKAMREYWETLVETIRLGEHVLSLVSQGRTVIGEASAARQEVRENVNEYFTDRGFSGQD